MTIAISGGRLALSGSALASGCSCCIDRDCCAQGIVACGVNDFGISESGDGWLLNSSRLTRNNLPRRLPVAIQFRYPNSINCAPEGSGLAVGNVVGCFSLSSPTTVRMSVSGTVEQQNFGYDVAFVEISEPADFFAITRAQIGSVGRGLGCSMTNASDTREILLGAGLYRYRLRADTVDGRFHVDMVHTFVIEEANPLP
jgi:hypothetical protein